MYERHLSDSLLPICQLSFTTPWAILQFNPMPNDLSAVLKFSINQLRTKNHRMLYDFELRDCHGNIVPLENYRNKVLLIVNVASACGYTPQYLELVQLHNQYHQDGFEIIAIPLNQFDNQEPLNSLEIERLVKTKFNVPFKIFEKSNVNGDKQLPLYAYLKSQKRGFLGFEGIKWNFEKFLIDRKGRVVARFQSGVTPLQLEPFIKALL